MSSVKRAKFLVTACLILIAAAVSASPALADAKRVALVIGNNDYENVPKLQKAVNDADAVAAELSKLGFDVVKAENVGQKAMSRAVNELETKIGSGDTVLFYFAGHGFAVDGTNYLLPVDVPEAGPGEEGIVRDASAQALEAMDFGERHHGDTSCCGVPPIEPAPIVTTMSPSRASPRSASGRSAMSSTKTGSTRPATRSARVNARPSAATMGASPAGYTSARITASACDSTRTKSSNRSRVRV